MNSTEQNLKTKSCHLRSISTRPEVFTKPLENSDYINYDYNSLFRTSYTDMSTKVK